MLIDQDQINKSQREHNSKQETSSDLNKDDIFDIRLDVSLLKKDILLFGKYFEKLDTTVDKISDLTSSMHRMITLHEERINVQTKDDTILRGLIDSLEKKIDGVAQTLTAKIEDQNQKLWKLDLKRASIGGAVVVFAFILGPLLSGYFQSIFSHIIKP